MKLFLQNMSKHMNKEKLKLTVLEERIKMISPRIKFLALHSLFCEVVDSPIEDDSIIDRIIEGTQKLINGHYNKHIIGFKENYFKIIYYEKGMNDKNLKRMYENRFRELDLQNRRKRQQFVYGSK